MIWLVVQCAILRPNNLSYVLYIFPDFFFKLFFLSIQAYVQQLESSRLKLTQLEQELQRARQQVCFCTCIILCPLIIWYLPFEVPFFCQLPLIGFYYYIRCYNLVINLFQGIFISSTGDQAQSMSGNGI